MGTNSTQTGHKLRGIVWDEQTTTIGDDVYIMGTGKDRDGTIQSVRMFIGKRRDIEERIRNGGVVQGEGTAEELP